MNPEGLAVVFAAQFEHDAAGVRSAPNGRERVVQTPLGLGCVRHEIPTIGAGDLFGFDAQDSHRRAIGPNEPRIKTLIHISNGRLIEEIAETLFACGQGLASLLELIANALFFPFDLRKFARG